MEDREIVELFLARDESALTQTQCKYGLRLLKIARKVLKQLEDAEEVCSDTLLKAWQSIPPDNPHNLGVYVAVICRNLALNTVKKQTAKKRKATLIPLTQELEEVLPGTLVDDMLDERESVRILNGFLEKLDREDRFLFIRRYFYYDSLRELAGYSGIKESVVKVRLFRIREKLKKEFRNAGIEV